MKFLIVRYTAKIKRIRNECIGQCIWGANTEIVLSQVLQMLNGIAMDEEKRNNSTTVQREAFQASG